MGICMEEVAIKSQPTTSSGIKTFRKIFNFQQLEKFINLCLIDVNQKIFEIMEDYGIFPTSTVINYRDIKDGFRARSIRHPMVSFDEFNRDPRNLNRFMLPFCKELEANILPGATSIGISVTNFKSIEQIKKQQSQKLNSFFSKLDMENLDQIEKYQEKKQKE